jgi:hypothetical protein
MRKFLAARFVSALLVAGTFPSAVPAKCSNDPADRDAHQAHRRHLRREHLLRSLLRHLPQRRKQPGETPFYYIKSSDRGNDVANNLITPLDPTKASLRSRA